MCRYRYMYYSGCCHAKLTLYDYCDDAYDAASLPTAPQGDCDEADEHALNHESEHAESHPSPHLTDFASLQNHSQDQHAADEDPVDRADRAHLTQRHQTYASIARTPTQCGSLEQSQRQKSATLASGFPNNSPAQKLASRFDQASKTLTVGRKTEPTSSLSTNPRSQHTNGSIVPAIKAGQEQADGGATSTGGKRIAENTNIWGGSIVPRDQDGSKSNLPRQATETCAFDLSLDSPNDFPNLCSQTQAGPSPSSFISEPRSRSDSTASWAQVARLTSAVRPTYGSTSGNTVADSDTGTASATSFSSFQAEDFDGSFTAKNMAPTGRETVPDLRGKILPPLTTTGLSSIPQTNRKTLPSEWLAASPNSRSPDVSRRKSVPSLRSAANSSKTASSPTKSTSSHSPGKSPTKSSTKSPTKVVPFKLETARRAAEREVKEKSSAELLKSKFKKTAKEAIDDPFSPSSLPSSSAVAAKHHPHATHTTYGHNAFTAEDHPWMPASPSHSRIPRLCNKFRSQEGLLSTHSELNAAIEHRGEDAQAQPPRLENFANPARQTLVQLHTNIERRPSPTIQYIEDISLSPDRPQSGDYINLGMPRTENGRPGEETGNAEVAGQDIKRRMVSGGSLADSSEDSTVILIDADVRPDRLRSSAPRTRQGTYPGATRPLKKTQQEAAARETPINHEGDFRRTSLQSQDSYMAPNLRVTSNAGTDTVVTPNEPYDVVSPSQGTHWSTHYAQDLGRTVPSPPTAKRPQHRRIMSAPRVMHPNPAVLRVGPDVAKMSTPAVELLRMLKHQPENTEVPAPRKPEPQPQAKTVTATTLNAQAKEFIPLTLAQTHQTSGPFVITPNPGPGFPRPQIPSEWANASWVNAIPAHQANDSGTAKKKAAPTEDAQQPQESWSASTDTAVSGVESAGPKGKKGKIKNRVGKTKQKGVTRVASAATSSSVANTNDSEQATGAASPQQSSGFGSTRASTPHPALSSGYTTPSGSGISNAATAGGSEEKTGTTAAAGPYAFRWDSTMRPSVVNLATFHTDDQKCHSYPSNTSNGAPSSSLGIKSVASHRPNMAESSCSGFQFQLQSSPHSPVSALPFYTCNGGWRSDGGGPLRFETFSDLRASMLGVTESQKWRPTYTDNTASNRGTGSSGKSGYLGYGINVSNNANNKNANGNSNKTWGGRGSVVDGLAAKTASMTASKRTAAAAAAAAASMAVVDYAALAPCASAQVYEAYEVLPHCPVPSCPECLPDQTGP